VTEDEAIRAIKAKATSDAASPVYPVATRIEIAEAERLLGLSLPSFYVRLLTEVGNGGFGPGYRIIGIPPWGFQDPDLGGSLIDAYVERTAPATGAWRVPKGLLPLCNWGCCQISYVDCLSQEASVVTGEALKDGFVFTATSPRLADWLADWARGADLGKEMHEITGYRDGINPFTRKPMQFPIRRMKGARLNFSDRD
jgi:SMI1-KNR4 cell-wall